MVWVLSYERNWGTRLARDFLKYYFSFKPTKSQCCKFLAKELNCPSRYFDVGMFEYGSLELYTWEDTRLIRDTI